MNKNGQIDWSRADWTLQDVVLAAQRGCTRERVRQVRKALALGVRADRHRRRTVPTATARLTVMATEGITLPDLAKLAVCGEQHAAFVLRQAGKTFKRRPRGNARYDWSKIPKNWSSLTDKQLAVLVGVGDPAVVAQWRNRHGYRRQATSRRGRRGTAIAP